MTFIERYNRLASMAFFIQDETTGTLKEFANKYDMTEDALIDHINILRDLAAEKEAAILYDREKETYYFSPKGKFTDFAFKRLFDNQQVIF